MIALAGTRKPLVSSATTAGVSSGRPSIGCGFWSGASSGAVAGAGRVEYCDQTWYSQPASVATAAIVSDGVCGRSRSATATATTPIMRSSWHGGGRRERDRCGVGVGRVGSVPAMSAASEPAPETADEGSAPAIAVIGTGYVGLTTGACLAHLGFHVVCADIDADKVARLEAGEIPIVEDGLDKIVADAVADGRLRFVVGAAGAAADADIVFLCVPTPQDEDGSADLSYIEAAAGEIGPVLRPGAVVVNKSTVPVGSTRVVERVLRRPDVAVVSNPEFLREGTAVNDFLHPDRVVIGGDDAAAAERVAALYRDLDTQILITDAASAETIKYAANGFLAMKISFVNAVAALCEAVGADVHHVIEGIGSDQRIGRAFLRPGPGWGGSCFPKDSRALVSIAAKHGYDFSMMRGVIAVNEEQRERMVAR